jgi:hypothetical protein
MTSQEPFNIISDPGHAWTCVPEEVTRQLGLSGDDFTRCSFYRAGHFYLEEDCDMATFVMAFHRKHGRMPEFKESRLQHDWRGRHWPRCSGKHPRWEEAYAYLGALRETQA